MYEQQQSYADMFQMAMQELKKQTDLYFEFKKKEFDKHIEETYGKTTKEDGQ